MDLQGDWILGNYIKLGQLGLRFFKILDLARMGYDQDGCLWIVVAILAHPIDGDIHLSQGGGHLCKSAGLIG